MRLEFKQATIKGKNYIDIWVKDADGDLAIELKYKTMKLSMTVGGEPFDLEKQGAYSRGRYDFLKDVERLESLAVGGNGINGYAVLLTNNRNYWDDSGREDTIDASFRLHEGRVFHGKLEWGPACRRDYEGQGRAYPPA